jgi:YVTN family beta-propeller protein
MAYGAGSVWVEDYSGNAVTRVDGRTGRRVRDYAVGTSPYDVAFAAGAAWSTDNADGTLTRIDAASGRTSKVQVGGSPSGIAPSRGLLWVADGSTDLVAVDPRTSRVVSRVPVGVHTTWTAYDEAHVWVSDTPEGKVAVVDTATRKVVGVATTGGRPADGDAVDGVAWFPDRDHGSVVGVDASGTVVGRHAIGLTDPFVLDAVGTTLWVGDFAGTGVQVVPLS